MATATRKSAPKSRVSLLNSQEATAAISFANGSTVDKLVSDMGTLQTSVQNTLAGLLASLVAKKAEVDQFEVAITEKQRRVKELTQMEEAAISLDELRLEIEQTRAQWKEEAAEHRRLQDIASQQSSEEHARQLAQQEYTLNMTREQKMAELKHAVEEQERQARIRTEELERGWALREEALKQREQEIVTMRESIAKFPEQMSTAVATAKAETTAALKASHAFEMRQTTQDAENKVALARQELAASNELVKRHEAQIAQLLSERTATENRVSEIIANALNVSAAEKRAAAVQETAAASAGNKSR